MMIAEVIVDVPAQQTDRTFDYQVPAKWDEIIRVGMRVVVPFGPRKLLGFVTKLKSDSEFKKLKEIIQVMELEPSLSEELIELGQWVADETMCYQISAFQAMLPAALKAKYEKIIRIRQGINRTELPTSIQAYFVNKEYIVLEKVLNSAELPLFKKEIEAGILELSLHVTNKSNVKKVRFVQPKASIDEMRSLYETLPKTANNQKKLLQYFMDNYGKISSAELSRVANVPSQTINTLAKKGLLNISEEEQYRDPDGLDNIPETNSLLLHEGQTVVLDQIRASLLATENENFLLFGVTGSGKTEIYLQAIETVIQEGKEAIVLVPEIALTQQMVTRFKGRFGDKVAVLHSGLSHGEKYDEWRKIQRSEVKVVVGARSAIFAPFTNIGIIIIDEEHESSYKQEENPRYHARDIAKKRAEYYRCPVVMGSATPSLESFARAQKGVYTLLRLPERINKKPLPSVSVIDMREELRVGNRSMFSVSLLEKLKDRLEKGEQSVLFLNKRGHSSFVMCRNCGLVLNCPQCDVSMTYHRVQNSMKCHYCGQEADVPTKCPDCDSEHIRYFGTGTQKVEEELGRLLPEARVIRMDVDTTSKKGAHQRLLQRFEEGKADILLGTQMIAKGLDFPNITLVGVLSADTMLHLPDFRSSEKTFQLLTQVSGRAGRHLLPGEVIIQTYTPEHYSIEMASDQDFEAFFAKEMQIRRQSSFPPYFYLALITVSHEDLLKTVEAAEKMTTFIRQRVGKETVVYGPAASPISRMNNRYRYQCLIKYKREPNLGAALKQLNELYGHHSAQTGLQLYIDTNPYIMM